jgi:hypothetical protein
VLFRSNITNEFRSTITIPIMEILFPALLSNGH